MDQSVRRTYLLARTLLDYLPSAPHGTLEGRLSGTPGGRRVPCTTCGARGRVGGPKRTPCAVCPPRIGPRFSEPRRGHGCTPCLVCEGTGWRRKRKSDPTHDQYVGEEVGSTTGGHHVLDAAELDREIERLDLLLNLWQAPERTEFGWEVRRQRQWRQGSYAELVVALEVVRERWPARHSLVWRAIVLGQYDMDNPERGLVRLSPKMLEELNATMHHIAHTLMPEKIRLPHSLREETRAEDRKDSLWRGKSPAHARARNDRDALIRAQRHDGMKINALARFHALDERRVKQIIAAGSQMALA